MPSHRYFQTFANVMGGRVATCSAMRAPSSFAWRSIRTPPYFADRLDERGRYGEGESDAVIAERED